MAIIKNVNILEQIQIHWGGWKCKIVQALWKAVWWSFKILNIELSYDSAIPLMGIHSGELKTYVQTKTCTWMFMEALLIKVRIQSENTIKTYINWWIVNKMLSNWFVFARGKVEIKVTTNRHRDSSWSNEILWH